MSSAIDHHDEHHDDDRGNGRGGRGKRWSRWCRMLLKIAATAVVVGLGEALGEILLSKLSAAAGWLLTL